MTDPAKNDFQNARKRGLHGWTQWRTNVNERLADTAVSSTPVPDNMDPIDNYLRKQFPRHHPASNPTMLLSYSADASSGSTCLPKEDYLAYGIPRVKLDSRHLLTSQTNLHQNADLADSGYRDDDDDNDLDYDDESMSEFSSSTGDERSGHHLRASREDDNRPYHTRYLWEPPSNAGDARKRLPRMDANAVGHPTTTDATTKAGKKGKSSRDVAYAQESMAPLNPRDRRDRRHKDRYYSP